MKTYHLLALLGLLITFPLAARDFSYTYEGQTLTYSVIEEAAKTCYVKYAEKVSGKLSIPENAVNGNSRYSVVRIDSQAFFSSGELTSVTIPKSVTEISYNPFKFLNSFTLTEINVDSDNPQYASHEGSLYNKDLTVLLAVGNGRKGIFKIPGSVKTIDKYAFSDCQLLKSVIIPNSVETIGYGAFWGCTSITSVTIPASVTVIDPNAFIYCESLTEINIDSANSLFSSFEGALYSKEKTTLLAVPEGKKGEFVIPPFVKTIGEYAFHACHLLTSIFIPASVEQIAEQNNPFWACSSLTEIKVSRDNPCYASFDGSLYNKDKSLLIAVGEGKTGQLVLPSSVEKIGYRAIYSCDNLTSVFIPGSVTEIDRHAFGYCYNLKKIYCDAETPPSCAEDAFEGGVMEGTLYVPVGSKSVYEETSPWRNFKDIVESDFAGIDAATASESSVTLKVENGRIFVMNKPAESAVNVCTIQGRMVAQTFSDEVSSLPSGIYIVTVGTHSFKVAL